MFQRVGEVLSIKNQGTALQQAAVETPYLLPIYGASEQNLQATYNRPFHPTNVFRDYPTGFTIFPVGKDESTCLIILQRLAAVSSALKGRKLVLSLSPASFLNMLAARPQGYAGNFSPLHAGELALNSRLSLALRQDAARRMLEYPSTLSNRPLLKFAIENLADGSSVGLACYHAVLPLLVVHNALLRYQDHWRVVHLLWKHPGWARSRLTPPGGRQLDWAALHRQADATYHAHSNNNEFGMDNDKWVRQLRALMRDAETPGRTRNSSARSTRVRNGSTWSFSCAS